MPRNFTASGHKPRKRFGQNFLQDEGIIDEILLASDVSSEDTILEIGPGKGAITGRLAEKAGRLIAVEIDWDLANILKVKFSGMENVTIIEGDVLKLDLAEILTGAKTVKVVANLPYYITTPIIMQLLESGIQFERIVVMVQKEVALRMCARHDTADYGALSVAVQFFTNPHIVANVPAHCFYPAPKVDSAVVALLHREPPCGGQEAEKFFGLVKAAFAQRRKTLTNALCSAGIADKAQVAKALMSIGKTENIRGEALSIEDFLMLSRRIGDLRDGD